MSSHPMEHGFMYLRLGMPGSPRGRGTKSTLSSVVFLGLCLSSLSGCSGGSGDSAGIGPQELSPAMDASAASRLANKYASTSTPGSPGYLVGPNDVLEITVFRAQELSQTVQVPEGGTINLPLVGQVSALGKSAREIERDIQSRLSARYMKSPQVTVFIKEYNSARVTLEGAVRAPGVYPLRGNETLMQVIAKGGGLDREVASENVVLFRSTNGSRSMVRFDLSASRNGAEDPRIMPGDVVVVEDSTTKVGLSYVLKILPTAGVAQQAVPKVIP
jgi:polysaccharide biosynthesis/export protein